MKQHQDEHQGVKRMLADEAVNLRVVRDFLGEVLVTAEQRPIVLSQA